jgi:nucleoside recognition membrane protein YjiH
MTAVNSAMLVLRGFGVVFIIFSVVAAYAAIFWWLDRRCKLADSLRRSVHRFAPAFLIFAPPIITYALVCGFLSLTFGVACD